MTNNNEKDLIDSLMGTCQKLSARYKNPQEQEDLYQEGFIKGLELIREAEITGEEISTLDLYGKARLAMFKYYNVSRAPVHVPFGPATRALADIRRGTIPENLEGTQRLLYAALTGETDSVEENTLKNNPEETYAIRNLYEKVLDAIITNDKFTLNESFVLYEVFYKEKTYTQVAEELKVSKQRVGVIYEDGLTKLKGILL